MLRDEELLKLIRLEMEKGELPETLFDTSPDESGSLRSGLSGWYIKEWQARIKQMVREYQTGVDKANAGD